MGPFGVGILILFGCLQALHAWAEPIDLKLAERIALERNLNLRAQSFDARAAEAVVRKGYGIYDPVLEMTVADGRFRDLSNRQDFTSASGIDDTQLNISLSQKLSTGADLALSFNNLRDEFFTPPEPAINPEYDSELKFSLVQPLLKDFGKTVTEQDILFAVIDREASVQDLRRRAFEILSQVRDAYFDILRYRDNLSYRETSVALAQKVLDENRAREKVGVLPPVEVLEAEVGLKERERDLLDARRAYRDALDEFALLLNAPGPVEVSEESLGRPEIDAGEERGISAALQKRPEIQLRLKDIERVRLESRIGRNSVLPALDLFASYSHKGVAEEYSDALDSLPEEDLRSWQVGMSFSYPLGNREAKNELARAEARLRESRALLAQLRSEIGTEIRAAIRLLEVNRNKIEVASRGRDLAEEKLRILLNRLEVGLATTREVLEGEEDLAQARTDQIAALADYNQAITRYLSSSGLLLEREGVRISGPLDPGGDRPLLEMVQE